MSEIKKYRVSFEVESHPKYDNNWAMTSLDFDEKEQFKQLEMASEYITIPIDAVIEDITPKPSVPDESVAYAGQTGFTHVAFIKRDGHWLDVSATEPKGSYVKSFNQTDEHILANFRVVDTAGREWTS